MGYRALALAAGLLAGLALATPVFAGGFLADTFIRPFDPDIAKQLDESHKKLGVILESQVPPATASDIKALLKLLSLKSDDDLLSLSFSLNLCLEIQCGSVPLPMVKQLINSTLDRNRALTDLEVRKAQALAAIASASISLLSLALSVISLRRASRSLAKPMAAPVAVKTESFQEPIAQNS